MIRKGQRCLWIFLLCIIGISGVFAQEGQRFALVIGNGDYQHTTPLANPINDAIDIAGSLEKFGFQVALETNTTTASMDQAIRQFVDFVSNNPTEIALFYYAGHGVQYEGVNYLLPVNVDIQNNYELMDKTISMDRITNGLDQSGSPFNLIMLDACRDNPFSETRGSSRGLSIMGDGGQGSMVVFATAPGSVAQDGEGSNSPFAGALLEHIT